MYEQIGIITEIMPFEDGITKAGKEWKKQNFILAFGDDKYLKQLQITVWNDKIAYIEGKEGQPVKVTFTVESNFYNGKYYTNATAIKIEALQNQSASAPAAKKKDTPVKQDAPNLPVIEDEFEDLPF